MPTSTPLARSAARQLGRSEPQAGGAADGDAVRLADLIPPAAPPEAPRAVRFAPGDGGAVRRAMARQTGLPLASFAAGTGAAPSPRVPGAPETPPTTPSTPLLAGARRVPLSRMRTIIAERLGAAKREAPHYYMSTDCVADALLAMGRDLSATLPGEERLSVNDLVLALVARCLARHPALNAAWAGDAIDYFDHVDLAVAVAVEGGLVTPVLRNAERLGLVELSREMRALADAARRRELARDALEGGTFTVSNLGMYDVTQFAAIVNPPQAAILAVAAARRRVVALDDTRTAVRRVMTLTLSVDHRVADGVAGAAFLEDLKRLIEEPLRAIL